MKFGWL